MIKNFDHCQQQRYTNESFRITPELLVANAPPTTLTRLKTIHRRLTPTATAVPVKGEAASAADHIAMDTVWKTATTVQDVTSAVAATPVSTVANVQMKELGDGDIMTAMDHLRAVYPEVVRLQHPGFGVCVVGHLMPRFKPVVRLFVQVLNIGNHWITATNKLTRNQRVVYWFHSLHGPNISPSTVMQLASFLRRQTHPDYIHIIHTARARYSSPGHACMVTTSELLANHSVHDLSFIFDEKSISWLNIRPSKPTHEFKAISIFINWLQNCQWHRHLYSSALRNSVLQFTLQSTEFCDKPC